MKNQQLISMNSLKLMILLSFTMMGGVTSAGKFNAVISIDDKLPTFDSLPSIDGNTYSSSDFDQDILILVSLSNLCPFSNGIESDLLKLVKDTQKLSVKVIAINYNMSKGDNLTAMKARAKQKKYNFIYLKDKNQQLGRMLGTSVTPEFFVFNKKRELIYMGLLHNSPAMTQGKNNWVYLRGEPKDFYVMDAIKSSLSNTPILTQETRAYGCSVEYSSPL